MGTRSTKDHSVRVVVVGRGQFPIDMLRYDRAHPRSEADSVAMAEARPRRRAVEVVCTGADTPTVGRWESFGWAVVATGESEVSRWHADAGLRGRVLDTGGVSGA